MLKNLSLLALVAITPAFLHYAYAECIRGCDEYREERVPAATKCSKWLPLTQARDGSIDWSPNGDEEKSKVADGMLTTKWHNQCGECDIHCTEDNESPINERTGPPSYGLSAAASFVFDDEDCHRIWDPQQRYKCQKDGT